MINISRDTILINEVPFAIFVKIENRILVGDKLLHIKDIKTNKIGIYVEK